MQIALQDIRTLGYKKISKKYLFDSESKEQFFNKINLINSVCYSIKIPPYSLLNKWNLIRDMDSKLIHGYSSFVYSLDPMIDLESPSTASKRKCRNSWNSIWSNFGKETGLSNNEIALLNDFGLKVLFLYSCYTIDSEKLKSFCNHIEVTDKVKDIIEDVIDFYNTVLKWSVFTQQESNFLKNNLSFIDVLNILVTCSVDDFSDKLRGIY